MFVLVACEESQEVTKAFRAKGHTAFSCDLQPCSGGHPEWHILGDVLPVLDGRCSFTTSDGISHFISGRWSLIIAHPPCTYFSLVNFLNYFRNGKFNHQRYEKALDSAKFFMRILNADCERICVENPLPMSLFKDILPPNSMRFQPYEFGDPFSKLTCLWLKNLPYLMPTILCSKHYPFITIDSNFPKSFAEQSRQRSKTFPGVALAMAEQWSFLD